MKKFLLALIASLALCGTAVAQQGQPITTITFPAFVAGSPNMATPPTGAEILPIIQSGNTRKITLGQITTPVTVQPGSPVTYQPWMNVGNSPPAFEIWDGAQYVTAWTLNSSTHAIAFSSAGITNGLGYTPLNRAGDSMLGELSAFPSSGSSAGFNFGQGSAPSSPANGDFWITSAGAFYRAGGTTIGPLIGASGSAVTSVFGRTGAVTASGGDYTAAQVTNAAQTNASNTFTGTLNNFTGSEVTVAAPTNASDAVTKTYADAISAGLDFKNSTYAATTANLNATYVNGVSGVGATLTNAGSLAAFSVDGVTPAANARILVKNQSTSFQNGIYSLTTPGSGAVAWVLTRTSDYNSPSEIAPGDLVPVQAGTANAGSGWLQTATVNTIGTDAISFSQYVYPPATFFQVANNLSEGTASTMRTNLGLGTAATANTGTSGATLGLLNGNLTFGGSNAYGTPASITLTNGTGLPVSTGITGLGTGVATALGVNVGTAGSVVVNGGALGTPSSGNASNLTSIPGGNIMSNTVANAALAQMPANTIKINNTGSTANAIDGTVSQTAALLGYIPVPQGRLTLVTGTPVMTANETAKGTIYYTPYNGTIIPIYDGTNMVPTVFAEISAALDATNALSGSIYDLFVYNDSGTIRLGYGPAWTNTTTRSAAISLQNGIWTNTSSITLRYDSTHTSTVSAHQGTYVGTFYTTANGQTGMNFSASGAGGGNPILGLYNAYNRVPTVSVNGDSNGTWTYATASFRAADNSNSNRISYIDGLAQSSVESVYTGNFSQPSGTGIIGIGIDSTTAPLAVAANAVTFYLSESCSYRSPPSLGFHYIQALEYGSPGTTTYQGNSALPFMLLSVNIPM